MNLKDELVNFLLLTILNLRHTTAQARLGPTRPGNFFVQARARLGPEKIRATRPGLSGRPEPVQCSSSKCSKPYLFFSFGNRK
uniref:Putative secreted protein n=1 Tax=Ixodes ricinus TaxID=34613 RepID=A0A147BEW6_IXORI